MAIKKYYWLKLKENFFRQKEIKKLRKIAGGDTYTIIYLKMLLLSLQEEGKLYFEGVEDDFAEELALELDEDVNNVAMTIAFLLKHELLGVANNDEYILTRCNEMLGKESDSAERVRRHRLKQKESLKALQCNDHVTNSNTEIEKEIEKEKDIEIEVSTTKVALIPKHLECIVIAWNNLNLSTVKSIQNTRLKLLNARIKDYGIDGVLQAINNIKESSFLKGQNNKNWTITFDWLIKPSNFIKVLEGNYTDKEDGSNARNIKKDNRTSEKPKYDFSCFA